MNPFLRNPMAYKRTPVRAEVPTVKTSDAGVATLRLYDPLDSWGEFWGVSAKEFVGAIDELGDDVTEIRLLINSPGGEVWEGLAILNALRSHSARVVAVVEGIAASAASFVAAGVDELVMMENAELFVHKAWGMAVGNADDMAQMANELSHEDRNIASIYAAKSGGSVDDWLAAMAADTWLSADEAVAAGLADRIEKVTADEGGATEAKNRFNLAIFNHQSGGRRAPVDPSPVRAEANRKRGTRMSLNTDIAERLGLAEDASDDDILAALDEHLAAEGDEGGEGEAPENRATELPEGVVAVDAALLADLQARAARGDEARTRQEADERRNAVDAAVRAGRIAPAQRDGWLARVQTDPRELDVLNKLTPVYPVGNEIGHSLTAPEGVPEAHDLSWFDSVPPAGTGK